MDIENHCILVMDYLSSLKCELEFRAIQITMGKNKVSLRAMDRESLSVMASSPNVIPPKLSMLLPCQTESLVRSWLGVGEHCSRCIIENGVKLGRTLINSVSG